MLGNSWHFLTNTGKQLDFVHLYILYIEPSVLCHCWLGDRKSNQPVKNERWGAGVVIHLERGADCLHMVQPLHPETPSSLASRLVLPFWYRLTQVVLENRPLNKCCCIYCIFCQHKTGVVLDIIQTASTDRRESPWAEDPAGSDIPQHVLDHPWTNLQHACTLETAWLISL